MRAILDTHTFLWWNLGDERLSSKARFIISDGQNELFLSGASAWEIAIKTGRGRLVLPQSPERYVAQRLVLHHINPLPIQLSHALHVFNLPPYHLDPFDRMLVTQSQLEKLPILTADPNIALYEVEVIWKYDRNRSPISSIPGCASNYLPATRAPSVFTCEEAERFHGAGGERHWGWWLDHLYLR